MDGPNEQSMGRRREARFPELLIAPVRLAGCLSPSAGRGPGVVSESEKYTGRGPGISFGGFWTGNVPLAQGGMLQVPWNALQEIRGSRTRNFIQRIADPEFSTRWGGTLQVPWNALQEIRQPH
ncbi:hypothetical protein B0H11DRAFT_1907402 [Mycena galericulata]|nr:hypothetical protein B0H11DRAFT_1907402 [Mycena galericulata]